MESKPPDPAPCMPGTVLQGPLPLTLHGLECIPLIGATEAWQGALQRLPPTLSSRGRKAWRSTQSQSTHLHGACCVLVLPLVECPLPVQGSTAGVSGSALSWASLHLPPGAPPPLKSWRERATRLPFRQVSFSPISAPLQPGERGEACLYRPRVARPPPGQAPSRPDGCTTGSSGREKPRPRSRRLLATSGLNLLCAGGKNFQASQS